MSEAAEFMAWHQQVAGRAEHRMHLADIAGYHHSVDVRSGDQDAVNDVWACQAQSNLAVRGNDDARRHEGELCRDDAGRYLAVLLDPGPEIKLGELASQ